MEISTFWWNSGKIYSENQQDAKAKIQFLAKINSLYPKVRQSYAEIGLSFRVLAPIAFRGVISLELKLPVTLLGWDSLAIGF